MSTIKLGVKLSRPANMLWDRITLERKRSARIQALANSGAYNTHHKAPKRYVAFQRQVATQ